jgi:hypothetical protein
MQQEYHFSTIEMYIQIAAAAVGILVFTVMFGIANLLKPGLFLIWLLFILLLFCVIYLYATLYPIRARLHETEITFIMLWRTVTVPITDIQYARSSNVVWLYYRGGKVMFSALPTNRHLPLLLDDLKKLNGDFYSISIFDSPLKK